MTRYDRAIDWRASASIVDALRSEVIRLNDEILSKPGLHLSLHGLPIRMVDLDGKVRGILRDGSRGIIDVINFDGLEWERLMREAGLLRHPRLVSPDDEHQPVSFAAAAQMVAAAIRANGTGMPFDTIMNAAAMTRMEFNELCHQHGFEDLIIPSEAYSDDDFEVMGRSNFS